MSVTDTVRHGSKQVIYEGYPELGYNYRLSDLQAAIGREQLQRLPALVARRRQLAAQYDECLRDIPGLEAPSEPCWARSNWQSYCVKLPHWFDQGATMQALLDRGISTRRGVMNIHLEAAYADRGSHRVATSLTRSVAAQRGTVILPLFAQMTDGDLTQVVEGLLDIPTIAEPAASPAGR